jgi:hypothetical protein
MTMLSAADQNRIKMTPLGWRWTLVMIAHGKRMISHPNCRDDLRLLVLEKFEQMTLDSWLTAEMIFAVDPMPDEGEAIIKESIKCGWRTAFDVWAKADVFTAFAAINPSLLRALELRKGR